MRIRKAADADLPKVISLLGQASLPTAGIMEHRCHLYVLEAQGTVVGTVGYEAYPPDALLRSLVVAPSVRGQGCGLQLIAFILEQAQRDGICDAYGLTTTIADLLLRSGFHEVTRTDMPVALLASEEFQGACPATARLFRISVTTKLSQGNEKKGVGT